MAVNVILGEIEPGKRLDGDTWEKLIVTVDYTDSVAQRRFPSALEVEAEYSALLDSPSVVCSDGEYIYIVNTGNYTVVTLDMSLVHIATLTTFNGGDDLIDVFDGPRGICCDGAGNVYVAATGQQRLIKFTSAAGVLTYDSEIACVNFPRAMDTDGTHLYVIQDAISFIQKRFCSDLTLDSEVNVGQGPNDICNYGGYLYVTRHNDNVQKRNASNLALVGSFGSTGAGDDNFNEPEGISTDGVCLYICDRDNDRLKVHLLDGTYVGETSDNITYLLGVDVIDCFSISHTETPSRVTENGVELTSRATLALCVANASSWYYDSANTRLYVHTSGSDDPGGGSYIIMSYFWEHISTHAGEYNGHWYYGRLNKENIPSIESSVSGPHEGVVTLSPGSISINNLPIQPATAGFYDSRLSTYVYEGAKIILLRGEQDAAYGTFEAFIHGYLGDWECDEKHFIPQIDDFRKYL